MEEGSGLFIISTPAVCARSHSLCHNVRDWHFCDLRAPPTEVWCRGSSRRKPQSFPGHVCSLTLIIVPDRLRLARIGTENRSCRLQVGRLETVSSELLEDWAQHLDSLSSASRLTA